MIEIISGSVSATHGKTFGEIIAEVFNKTSGGNCSSLLEKDEQARRKRQLLWYLFRSPFYTKFTKYDHGCLISLTNALCLELEWTDSANHWQINLCCH